jgi:hypothetical protein|tara:strand:- start:584 stop:1039 length:456 start_codon:yes stop_codon:yes gene_type:complete
MSQIKFKVNGKPPKKKGKSMWSKGSTQTQAVLDLRQKAYDSSKGIEIFRGAVKLTLTIYDPNPLERIDRHDYLGDLDALIGGVCDALQKSPPENNELIIHDSFKEKNEIRHDKELIISDDAQITTTISQKRKNNKDNESYYIISIEKDDEF